MPKKPKEPTHIGEKIRKLAEQKHITVKEMSQWFNKDRTNMYTLLKQRDWRISDILIAAGHLGIAPYYIIADEGNVDAVAVFNAEAHLKENISLKEENKQLHAEVSELKNKLIQLHELIHKQ